MSARDEALRRIGALPGDAGWDDVLRALEGAAPYGAAPGRGTSTVREFQAPYGAPEAGAGSAHTEEGSAEMGYVERITIEPGKRGGKPCVRGLRITVYDVLGYLASGMSEDEVLADFPDLERADVRACLAFAADGARGVVRIPA